MSMRLPLVLAAVLVLPFPAAGQDLPCPDFQVNTDTTGGQLHTSVAALPGGDFVVIWGSTEASVRGRRFGPGGAPAGPEFHVGTLPANEHGYPKVRAWPDGRFVSVWESRVPTYSGADVLGRVFDAAGAGGPEFVVNAYTTGYQGQPAVATLGPGEFVVAWTGNPTQPGSQPNDIFARRFGPGGALGDQFQVSTTNSLQQEVDVAGSPTAGFLVTWMSGGQDGDAGAIVGRRYDAAGTPLGGEFLVNSYTTTHQRAPRAAFDASGNFVVVWRSFRDAGTSGIFARLFDPAGQPRGPEFQVNTYTPGEQYGPEVAFDSSGSFQVVWWGQEPDTSLNRGVFARRFGPSGEPEGPEFPVPLNRASDQGTPALASLGNRGFVTAWFHFEDGSSTGIRAGVDCARLYTVPPCRVADTRLPPGPSGGPRLAANSLRSFPVTGTCNIPADARAVAVNVTAVNPTDMGFLSLYPTGQAVPFTSTVNFAAGVTRAGNAMAPLGASGQVGVWCAMPAGSAGGTDLVLDVYGYFRR